MRKKKPISWTPRHERVGTLPLAIMGVSFHVGWARTFLVGFSSRSPGASYRTLTRSSSVSPCELSVLEGRHPERKQVKRYIYTCWSNTRFEKRLLPQGFWFWVHLCCCNILFLIKNILVELLLIYTLVRSKSGLRGFIHSSPATVATVLWGLGFHTQYHTLYWWTSYQCARKHSALPLQEDISAWEM